MIRHYEALNADRGVAVQPRLLALSLRANHCVSNMHAFTVLAFSSTLLDRMFHHWKPNKARGSTSTQSAYPVAKAQCDARAGHVRGDLHPMMLHNCALICS